jgi:golgin subfamily B member 1
VKELEARIVELENELETARSEAAVEVDVSGLLPRAAEETEDSATIHKRVRHEPREATTLRALYAAARRENDPDLAFRVAQALVWLGAANEEEHATYAANRHEGLIRPTTSLTGDLWRRSLYHPDQEALTGEIFAVIAPAVLLGRIAVLRRSKALPALAPERRLDPRATTVAAGRCFGWAASILGMPTPAAYADPEWSGALEVVPNIPPASRIGKLALSGRSPAELAFLVGKHLAWFREEHFVRLLVQEVPDLEDVFLAALCIGSPALPLNDAKKRKVEPIARAIEPLLEPVQIDRLRGAFLRFVEEGGRTNLQRWAAAVDRTTARAGFLLSGDLAIAERMLNLEAAESPSEVMDDLVVFATGERYGALRKRLGIAVTT